MRGQTPPSNGVTEPVTGGAASSQNATPCLNCGQPGTGRFCAQCGQRKVEVRVSLRRLIADVLEDQLSIDATLPRTLRALVIHPGRLTTEYVSGRIAAYIAPFRLYLVASLLFFLTLSLMSRDPVWDEDDSPPAADTRGTAGAGEPDAPALPTDDSAGVVAGSSAVSRSDSVPTQVRVQGTEQVTQEGGAAPAGPRRIGVFLPPGASPDSANWMQDLEVNTGSSRLDSLLVTRLRRLGRLPRNQVASAVVSGFLQRAPTMMFLMLPVFALMLKVLHLGSGRFYVEHFVFALHYHAFAFILYALMLMLEPVPVVSTVLGLWVFFYLPIAMKRVYRHGWIVTTLKWFVLGISYIMLLSFVLFATLIVTALML